MKVEHYKANRFGEIFYRWRIVEEAPDGVHTIVQGERFHKTLLDCKSDFDQVADFMGAVLQERVKAIYG